MSTYTDESLVVEGESDGEEVEEDDEESCRTHPTTLLLPHTSCPL